MPREVEVNSSNIFFPLLGQNLFQKIENKNKITMIYFFFFFLIGNRNFIDIKEHVFMMMNTQKMKQMHTNQELKLVD